MSWLTDNISKPLSQLVYRCDGHDNAAVDMWCTLSSALNEMNEVKHTNTDSDSSLSPNTTACSDKSSIHLSINDDKLCIVRPHETRHNGGSPLETSSNISAIFFRSR